MNKEICEKCKHNSEENVMDMIKQLNKGINSLIESRKKWKNRYYKAKTKLYKLKNIMIADKMEQFDDYTIYLIESYLKILEG